MKTPNTRVTSQSKNDVAVTILRDVPWSIYEELRDLEANYHQRMTYYDGTLIFVYPSYIYENNAQRLALLVRMVAVGLGIDLAGTGTLTLRRKGIGNCEGIGKEPENGFYIGVNEKLIKKNRQIDLKIDPPPDLAIEADQNGDFDVALSAYAGIGVPEVWRYDAENHSIWFGRLVNEVYETIDRSLSLPVLTPTLVIEALDVLANDDMSETKWIIWLMDWARSLPALSTHKASQS